MPNIDNPQITHKKQIIWARVSKVDGYEYKKGDLIDVCLLRRTLKLNYKPKYEKIIKVYVYEK